MTVTQAPLLLCVPKKDGSLHMVVDTRLHNNNILHDVILFPDQDQIRMDIAKAKIWSKINLSDMYEQIWIEVDDILKTAFTTVYGTFISNVMQQGDCNTPSTFQQLMIHIFQEYIGIFVHVYLDNIFIFSNSIEKYEKHLELVFDRLHEAKLYLKSTKCNLYLQRIDCLGHIIDNQGIHTNEDKISRIQEW